MVLRWGIGLIGVNCGQEKGPTEIRYCMVWVCVCVWFVLRMGGVRQGFLAPAIPTKDGGCDRTIKVKCDVQVMWCHLHCLHE